MYNQLRRQALEAQHIRGNGCTCVYNVAHERDESARIESPTATWCRVPT
jgi:hypothetical protein